MNHRNIETAALKAIESAQLSESQRYTAWLLIIVRQYLIENPPKGEQPKPLENWSTEEIIEFGKKHENVRPLPH
jgi:hypothetical protein